jgi:predicted nucleotidyltransferase
MTRQSDKRAHLDLQVNMLTEQEMTMMLRMQQRLCEHLGVEVDTVKEEAKQLLEETNIDTVVSELEEKLPG